MKLPSGFVMKTVRATTKSSEQTGNGKMLLILGSRYAFLQKALMEVFEGQEDVEVLVDRRHGKRRPGERRKNGKSALSECSEMDRRKPKEEVLEIVLSA